MCCCTVTHLGSRNCAQRWGKWLNGGLCVRQKAPECPALGGRAGRAGGEGGKSEGTAAGPSRWTRHGGGVRARPGGSCHRPGLSALTVHPEARAPTGRHSVVHSGPWLFAENNKSLSGRVLVS